MTTTDRTSTAMRLLAATAVVGGWLGVAVLTWPGTAASNGSRPGPPTAETPLALAEPLELGPISFFNASCGPCHGDYGMLLREELPPEAAQWDSIRSVIRGMVIGQAQTTLPEREIDALAAYRLSLLDGTPYVAFTGASDGEMRGEVTPGATVQVLAGGSAHAAAVDGHLWTAPLPAGAGAVTVRAALGGRTTVLPLAEAAFSHGPER